MIEIPTSIKKNFLTFLAIILFIFLMDFLAVFYLYPYSGDFQNYLSHFNGNGGERFEIGYRSIVSFFNMTVGDGEKNFLFFLFIISFITVSIKSYVVWMVNGGRGFILFYFIYFFLLHEANQLRVSIGISFGVLSLLFLSQRRSVAALLLIIVACLFHYSMLVFFVVPLISLAIVHKKKYWLYFASFVLLVTVYELFNPTFFGSMNPLMVKYGSFNLGYKFNRIYLFLLFLLVFVGLLNYRYSQFFAKIAFHSYVFILGLAISLSNIPIVAVRVMDIANILAFYYVFSFRLSTKLRVVSLYLVMAAIAIPRFLVFIFTDTIYRFPQ